MYWDIEKIYIRRYDNVSLVQSSCCTCFVMTQYQHGSCSSGVGGGGGKRNAEKVPIFHVVTGQRSQQKEETESVFPSFVTVIYVP